MVGIMIHSEHHAVLQKVFPHLLEQLTKGLGENRPFSVDFQAENIGSWNAKLTLLLQEAVDDRH